MYRYEDLFGRNFPLITEKEQKKLKSLKVAIVGVGALSFTAEYLARLGVEKFVLIDGDQAQVENINHQRYCILPDVGKNKAQALSEYLSKVNPETKVIALPIFLDEQNFDEIWNNYLSRADVVIDGIDPVPGIIISKKLAQKCEEQKIGYLYPLDLGNGALVIGTAEKFLNLVEGNNEPMEMLMKMIQRLGIGIPTRVETILQKLMKMELKYYPQTVVAAVTASIITTAVILRKVQGKKIPAVVYCDFVEGFFYYI
jgi:molybdopterin/thiamine biosynthesis adenylyltransferase